MIKTSLLLLLYVSKSGTGRNQTTMGAQSTAMQIKSSWSSTMLEILKNVSNIVLVPKELEK
jgi:hypothetical protein